MNSRPAKSLQNTCGGISGLGTYKTPVRILVMKDGEGEGEHLELVFGDDVEHSDDGSNTIKANRAYGALPSTLSATRFGYSSKE